ncbi:D-tyrosyl-tRNA(Tyr) deacylase [Deinococcus sp. Arct2-2]|uniref:D-aminoacyl-tRNA deacylase n=1 Tax=Deinococcus sp. Arct2-2 TaxID=2568653 RepID=UPI0010A44F7D|nr:D-aminoacyl-tRNA deacylase [Deinococcus sp. Arct2-2]THF68807.1 D-tyrosyl-tRNA(Tyr) deacylase [Deinococcus sp. Arct2-2]
MRAVLQRVTRATCTVEGQITGQVGAGFMVLLGVAPGDIAATAAALAQKIVKLRVFNDAAGKMNLALADAGGAVLSISQFTLYADTRRGNRPGFSGAAAPDHARALYAEFNAALRSHGVEVQEGVFGAHMVLDLTNDGPVTLMLDTAE